MVSRLKLTLLVVLALPLLILVSPVIGVVLWMVMRQSEAEGVEYLSGNKDRE